ncbi:hypothetical protein [Ferrimonas pelagia]|uniref:Uncharacterized protein n=1 Tax=Ferrimonas pelagia TaxID=1177826 RepID=A0ABP9FHR9_9GAMM
MFPLRLWLPLMLLLPIAHAKILLNEADTLLTLQGNWLGTMEFVDTRTGKLTELPLALAIESTADQRTLIHKRRFLDPQMQVETLMIRTLSEPGQVAYVRDGRMKHYQTQIAGLQILNPDAWVMVLEHKDNENNRPITVRHTLRRSGEQFSDTKEIDYLDDRDIVWQLRYRTDYLRTGDALPLEQQQPFELLPRRRGAVDELGRVDF